MNFGFLDPWHRFLPRDPGHVIALMGSGGKTSLMLALAEFYREISRPVILAATTRCEILPGVAGVDIAELPAGDAAALPEVFFLHAGVLPDGKWAGLSCAQVDGLGETFADRSVIVEVDGSAGLPVKLHRGDEPVWPGRTSLGIIVMGTSAVGSKAGDVLHRFGRITWPPLEGVRSWSVWEWDHSFTLLSEPGGYLSRVPGEVPCVLALTGMDEQADSIGLFEFVGRAMELERLPLAMFCDLASDPRVIRTAYLDKDEKP